MNLTEELGVQSYSLRRFEANEEAAKVVKSLGMSKIELCFTHVTFSDKDSFQSVIDVYRDADVDIVSTGVITMADNESKERNPFEFAKQAGAKHMSVAFDIDTIPGSLRTAEKLADEYDMRLGIHNHGARHWLGCFETLSWIFSQTSERIGLCLDTGWALDSGEKPAAIVKKYSERLYGVHFKDFTFDRSRTPQPVVAGAGAMDLEGVVRALESIDFDGYAVIEHETEPRDPVPDIEECARAIRELAK